MRSAQQPQHVEYRYHVSCSVDQGMLLSLNRVTFTPGSLPFGIDLRFGGTITGNGLPLHADEVSSRAAPEARPEFGELTYSDWLSFPVKVSDLTLDAHLVLTGYTPDGRIFGGTCMNLFDERGCLRVGKQKLLLFTGSSPIDGGIDSTTRGDIVPFERSEDMHFRVSKAREMVESGAVKAAPVFDQQIFDLYDRVAANPLLGRAAFVDPGDGSIASFNHQDLVIGDTLFVEIELPRYPYPIIHEERRYQVRHDEVKSVTTSVRQRPTERLNRSASTNSIPIKDLVAPVVCFDYENDQQVSNPSEEMRRKIMHDQLRGKVDPDLKPDIEQNRLIDKILADPSDLMSNDEKDLLWMFGYTLTSKKNAVVKFVLAVDWNDDTEVEIASMLLGQWAKPDIAYALKLLSDHKEFEHAVVRSFAVQRLDEASDSELEMYLLQLVAALRYEPKESLAPSERRSTAVLSSDAAAAAVAAAAGSRGVGQGDGQAGPRSLLAAEGGQGPDLSPLAQFLIRRSCSCEPPYALAIFLHWFLVVEAQSDELFGEMYTEVLEAYMSTLPDHVHSVITRQHKFAEAISQCQLNAYNTKGNRDVKQKTMSRELEQLAIDKSGYPLPLNPSIVVNGVDPKCKIFQSALYPAAVKFWTAAPETFLTSPRRSSLEKIRSQELQKRHDKAGKLLGEDKLPPPETKGSVKLMIKNGDDVRQDQLIVQLIKVMDPCLKRVGLDLKLTVYGVLATSDKSGLLEFVTAKDGSPSTAIELMDMSIADYLRKFKPDESTESGIKREAMDAFTKSMAGYAVITYLLGVGDRHLGNLMMLPDGRMCHIDFGYIFGDDPKKKFVNPPPFRITKSMVDAMGGQKAEQFQEFCRISMEAYKELRRNAALIMSLLRLMKDAGIEALTVNPEAKFQTVEDRFRLDLNDEEAEQFFMGLILESMSHVGIQVLEGFHNLARILR